MAADEMTEQKARASAWFRTLRDEIVAAFEEVEDAQESGPFADVPPGRFEVSTEMAPLYVLTPVARAVPPAAESVMRLSACSWQVASS